MSHYDEFCEFCGNEVTYGGHERWCLKVSENSLTVEEQTERVLAKFDAELTVAANRRLRFDLHNAFRYFAENLRMSAPWSKDQKPWFDEHGKRRENRETTDA